MIRRFEAGAMLDGRTLPFPAVLCPGAALERTFAGMRADYPGAVIVGTRFALVDDLSALDSWRRPLDILHAAAGLSFGALHEKRLTLALESPPDDGPTIALDQAEEMLGTLIHDLHLEDSVRKDGMIEADAIALLTEIEEREEEAQDAVTPAEPSAFDLFAKDPATGMWRDTVAIVVLSAVESAEIPAHYDIGGWSNLPKPEGHIVYMRHWAERYGAEVVGFALGKVSFVVARPPKTLSEARILALEHVSYCPDCLETYGGAIEELAQALIDRDTWSFAWV